MNASSIAPPRPRIHQPISIFCSSRREKRLRLAIPARESISSRPASIPAKKTHMSCGVCLQIAKAAKTTPTNTIDEMARRYTNQPGGSVSDRGRESRDATHVSRWFRGCATASRRRSSSFLWRGSSRPLRKSGQLRAVRQRGGTDCRVEDDVERAHHWFAREDQQAISQRKERKITSNEQDVESEADAVLDEPKKAKSATNSEASCEALLAIILSVIEKQISLSNQV